MLQHISVCGTPILLLLPDLTASGADMDAYQATMHDAGLMSRCHEHSRNRNSSRDSLTE